MVLLEPASEVRSVDRFLRGRRPENAIIVKANWRDNPWFPSVLEGSFLLELIKRII